MLVELTEKIPKKALRYAKRTYKPGDTLEMNDRDARLFIALGQARKYSREDVTAEDLAPSTDAPKRRYRRRDMQAE